jgi:hypothetical protein
VFFGGGVNLIKLCGDQVSFDLFGGFHVREKKGLRFTWHNRQAKR